jgi:hypothetical protein
MRDDYDDAFNNGQYSKVTKTVNGDTNSPSIISAGYTNKYGNLEKQSFIHEGTEYTDIFLYDYAGRVVETYNVFGQHGTSKYDAIGRL